MLDRSWLQRLSSFSNPRASSTSWDRDPSSLASLLDFISWAMTFQHWSSWVTRGSPRWQLKFFCTSPSSPGGGDQVIISGSASSSCCEGPASSSSLTKQMDSLGFLFLYRGNCSQHGLFLWLSCSWECPQCLLLCLPPSPPPPRDVLSSDEHC